MNRLVLIPMSLIFLGGCASVSKQSHHMESDAYKSRPQLTQALSIGSEPLSEASIQKILSSRVKFPRKVQLAVVRLSENAHGLQFQQIDQKVVDQFYDRKNWGDRVSTVFAMPQVMLPSPVTIQSLRQAAVLLQADALVIVKPASYSDWKFKWTEENTAKSVTTLEVLLLDTRTSIIPYTAVVTETAEVSKDPKSDYSNYEVTGRAALASEAKALAKIPGEISNFISKAL